MNRITFRIAIALLTFVVGVAAVSLWFFLRRNVGEKKVEQKRIEQPVAEMGKEQPQEVPKVKSLYISDPIKWNKCAWGTCAFGYITVFYENGDWARVRVSLSKETNSKIAVTFSDGRYGIEAGRWEETNKKELKVTIERCKCILCDEMPMKGYTKEESRSTLPIIESWKVKSQISIETLIEIYRLLNRDEFFIQEDIESVISARYLMWKDYDGWGEPCSKFPEYKNRFSTKSK